MPESTSFLDAIEVKSPCSMSWEGMSGDERKRFCRTCKLHVYNLSEMTRAEAEALIRREEGHLCARFHRRPDGTILTKDCGAVVAARKRRTFAATVAVLLGLVASAYAAARSGGAHDSADYGEQLRRERYLAPLRTIPVVGPGIDKIIPPPQVLMGDIAVPMPAAAPRCQGA